MHSKDITEENIEKISALFPNCITEATDEQGRLRKKIDFDLLRQELSREIVEGPQERYQLNWPGKRQALLTANAPTAKTLRPCPEESVDFNKTKNLFIEGDNLEVLKMLQETYLGKVKMIYIDPPYNTGRDFIYSDKFSKTSTQYLIDSQQHDSEGNNLVTNSDANGRFHSDWLSMIYSRIKLSRNLLREDGVIFISIDDNEFYNLKKICDEIFGEENFIETFIWVKKTAPNNVVVGSVHEYILLYAKNKQLAKMYLLPRDEKKDKEYKNPDNDPRGRWKPDNLTAAAKGGRSTPSLLYKVINPNTGQEHFPPNGRMWAVNEEEMLKKIKEGTVYWGKDGNGKPMDKRFLSQTRAGRVASTLLNDVGSNNSASKELACLFKGQIVFETPKPVELLLRLLRISVDNDDIALDFFAGSASLAHAIFELNVEKRINSKFILVQIHEQINKQSESYKAGFNTIAEIGKERIRLAGKKIQIENSDNEIISDLDIGFRVLKTDTSNMTEVFYTSNAINQDLLTQHTDNVKPERTPDDLLFQVLLDWGVDLTLPISKKIIHEHKVFFVDDNALVACFDNNGKITEEFVKELTQYSPLRVVFRDAGFASDSVKINVTQIFKQLSPHTEVKTI
ncbi:DNA methyltransferase [Legionella pneumophila serogroup 1]|uniref:site-specific DNA-methyltransferase n=1 Tax=Legionella pneumophila TaxID=446 RepID=UPI0022B4A9DC|nr:DNA methyltransferase [Legionella pneumophila]MCZ4746920.1 DNA methyltransferase [Legionella pneumophila]